MTVLAPDPVTLTSQLAAPYLAVDVQPDSSLGMFVLDVSELDGPDLLAWDSSDPGTWVNVVCDVMAASYRRGATRLQGVLTQAEAGTCTLTVSDTARRFDPMTNADVIHKGTPLRLRAWGYDLAGDRWDGVLFTGEIDELGVRYQKTDAPVVTITGLDLVGVLAAWQAEGRPDPGVGAGDDLLGRVQRTLTEVGRGTVSPDCDVSYAAALAPVPLAQPWQELTAATEAELGRLWVDSANRLVVRARDSQLSGVARGTLSDTHGEAPVGVHCCVADALVLFGVEQMGNRALAARRRLTGETGDTALVRLDDELSQARHGVGVVDQRNLAVTTDDQLMPWAQAVVAAHSRPELRVDSVTPAPSGTDLDSAVPAWQAVAQTDLGDRWRFLFRPDVGPPVDRMLGVLGIDVSITPDAWAVSWTTTDASPATGSFVLDVSELDGPDLLTPYGVTRVQVATVPGVSAGDTILDGGAP